MSSTMVSSLVCKCSPQPMDSWYHFYGMAVWRTCFYLWARADVPYLPTPYWYWPKWCWKCY